MHRTTLVCSASALLAAGLLSFSGTLLASGADGLGTNSFAPEYYVPQAELPAYAGGRLGVVVPSYWRVYHTMAYRALTGHPLSKAELDTLKVDGFNVGGHVNRWSDTGDADNGVDNWLKARATIKGAAPVQVGVSADIGDFTMILNCPVDAFERAGKTLAQRLASGGAQWAAVWLAGQDAVFANCSPPVEPGVRGEPQLVRPLVLPKALPAKAPVWLQKDDAYQRAAAHFYSGRYAEARTAFLAIAADPASPWQPLGKYLAARCLIRSATATATPQDQEVAKRDLKTRLEAARAELAAIAPTYAPANALVDWIDVRIRPDERRRALSATLAVDPVVPATVQKMTDYLVLMDRLDEEHQLIGAGDAMTAWIGVMQAGTQNPYGDGDSKEPEARRSAALAVARAQWERSHEVVWLVAILTNADSASVRPAERKAAVAVKTDSPAYVTLQYQLARLAIAEGRAAATDSVVTALLKGATGATRNRLLRMKMVTAPTAEAALAAAARLPADREAEPIPNEGKTPASVAQYDSDLRQHRDRHLPLTTLVKLRKSLPPPQQRETTDLIWSRAVLLDQHDIALALSDDLAKGRDTTRHLYERYKKAATPEAKRDAALLVLANTPELGPRVEREQSGGSGSGMYWACEYGDDDADGMGKVTPAFLTAEERALSEKEHAQLLKLPRRSAYLIPLVIEWARNNKADPEAPKALHYLIASTRNECGGGAVQPNAPNYSKLAFEFLHRQFPKSEWTAKTRYYY